MIRPLNDVVFHTLFAKNKNIHLAEHFLKPILKKAYISPIISFEVEEREMSAQLLLEKVLRHTIKVQTEDQEERVYLQLQITNKYYVERPTFYHLVELYTEKMEEEKDPSIEVKVISINILDDIHFDSEKYHHIIEMREEKSHFLLSEEWQIHFLELPKVSKSPSPQDLEDPLICWILFLQGAEGALKEDLMARNELIKDAYRILEDFKGDEEAMWLYQLRERALMEDDYMLLEERMIIAKKLKEREMKEDLIAECTGLTKEELRHALRG